MADQKISELNEKTTIHDTDLVPLVDIEATPDETKKITGANLKSQIRAGYLAAPTGTAEWESRTYQGWELVTTATEYTVGSGQDFATIADAAASLRGLILVANVTVKLMEAVTITSEIIFRGIIFAGGTFTVDLNGYNLTINFNGVGIHFQGHGYFWVIDSAGAPYNSVIAGASAGGSTYLVRWNQMAMGLTMNVNFDANSKGIAAMIRVSLNARLQLYDGTVFLDTGSGGLYGNALELKQGCFVSAKVTAGVSADDFVISQGAMAIDSAGHIHTEAGEWNTPDA